MSDTEKMIALINDYDAEIIHRMEGNLGDLVFDFYEEGLFYLYSIKLACEKHGVNINYVDWDVVQQHFS